MPAEFVLESDFEGASDSDSGDLYRSQTLEDYLQRKLEEDPNDPLIEDEKLNAVFLRWLRVFSSSKPARKPPKSKLDLALGRFNIDIQVPTNNEKDDFSADNLPPTTDPAIRGKVVLEKIEKYITDEASRNQLYKIFTVADDLCLFGIDPFTHATHLNPGVAHRFKIKIHPDGKIIIQVITKVSSLKHPTMVGPNFEFKGTQPIFTSIMTYAITPAKDQKAIVSIVKHEELINLNELKQEVSKQTGKKKEVFSSILNDLQKYCGFEPKSIKTPSCKYYQSLDTATFNEFEYHNKTIEVAPNEVPIQDAVDNLKRINGAIIRNGVQVGQWKIAEKNLPQNYHINTLKALACDPEIEAALMYCFAQQNTFLFSGINKIQNFFTFYELNSKYKPYINDESINLKLAVRKIGKDVFVTIHTTVNAFKYPLPMDTDTLINSDTPFYQSSITYQFTKDVNHKNATVKVVDFQEVLEDMEPIIKMNKEINEKRSFASENIINKYMPVYKKERHSVEVNTHATLHQGNQNSLFTTQHTESLNKSRADKMEILRKVNTKNNCSNVIKARLEVASSANVTAINHFEEIINKYAATLPKNDERDVGIAHHVIHVLKDSLNKKGKKLLQSLEVISAFEKDYISSHMTLILSSFNLIQLSRLHKKLRKVLVLEGHQQKIIIYKKMFNAIEDKLIQNKIAHKKFVEQSDYTEEINKCIKAIRKHISSSYKIFKFLGGQKIDFMGAIETLGSFAGTTQEVSNRLHNLKTTELIEIYKRINRIPTLNAELLSDIIIDILEDRGISSKYIVSNDQTSTHLEETSILPKNADDKTEEKQEVQTDTQPEPMSPKSSAKRNQMADFTM